MSGNGGVELEIVGLVAEVVLRVEQVGVDVLISVSIQHKGRKVELVSFKEPPVVCFIKSEADRNLNIRFHVLADIMDKAD
ncbi:hypothetical protein DGG96_08405 [Legionella qingyii]|uniref:Uncharacterized protein n=1 Tax=Legionella qingyii TaxID=2184757 RepID=A0A317U279_9GAMM|nr:hypothetical protein [Legionella qingyii]PWY56154.1 hypothetical protein DGG96_08405 [Legionella qingyii]